MKILAVCAAGRVFGKEAVTLSLVEGLRDRGHEVLCLTSTWSDHKFEKRLNELSIPSRRLPLGFVSKTLSISAMRMTLAQAARLPALWLGYKSVLRSFRPDIVIHSASHHVVLLWPFLGKEVNIFHVHDAFAPSPFYRRIFRLLGRRMTAFVGVSKFVAESLLYLGVPRNKVHYVLNGVNVENHHQPDQNGSFKRNGRLKQTAPIRIGIVGQIEEWKGHEDLIEALGILDHKKQSFICRIFGSGSPEFIDRLKKKIIENELANKIEWRGFVDEKKEIYQSIDICVVPSRVPEAFGLVAAEASMYGVPVIASSRGGLPEVIVNGQTGYIVDAESPAQIAERIQTLSSSAAALTQMGMNATAHVSLLINANRMTEEMEALLGTLSANPRISND